MRYKFLQLVLQIPCNRLCLIYYACINREQLIQNCSLSEDTTLRCGIEKKDTLRQLETISIVPCSAFALIWQARIIRSLKYFSATIFSPFYKVGQYRIIQPLPRGQSSGFGFDCGRWLVVIETSSSSADYTYELTTIPYTQICSITPQYIRIDYATSNLLPIHILSIKAILNLNIAYRFLSSASFMLALFASFLTSTFWPIARLSQGKVVCIQSFIQQSDFIQSFYLRNLSLFEGHLQQCFGSECLLIFYWKQLTNFQRVDVAAQVIKTSLLIANAGLSTRSFFDGDGLKSTYSRKGKQLQQYGCSIDYTSSDSPRLIIINIMKKQNLYGIKAISFSSNIRIPLICYIQLIYTAMGKIVKQRKLFVSKKPYYRQIAQKRKTKWAQRYQLQNQEQFKFHFCKTKDHDNNEQISMNGKADFKSNQKIKNRLAAQQSREKRKYYLEEIQKKLQHYEELLQTQTCRLCFSSLKEKSESEFQFKDQKESSRDQAKQSYFQEGLIRVDNEGATTPFAIFFFICFIVILTIFTFSGQSMDQRMLSNHQPLIHSATVLPFKPNQGDVAKQQRNTKQPANYFDITANALAPKHLRENILLSNTKEWKRYKDLLCTKSSLQNINKSKENKKPFLALRAKTETNTGVTHQKIEETNEPAQSIWNAQTLNCIVSDPTSI